MRLVDNLERYGYCAAKHVNTSKTQNKHTVRGPLDFGSEHKQHVRVGENSNKGQDGENQEKRQAVEALLGVELSQKFGPMSAVVQHWKHVFINRMERHGACLVLYTVVDVVALQYIGNDSNILYSGSVVIQIVLTRIILTRRVTKGDTETYFCLHETDYFDL